MVVLGKKEIAGIEKAFGLVRLGTMKQNKIELVVFDLGGVFIGVVSGWIEAYQRANFPAEVVKRIENLSEQEQKMLGNIWYAHDTGGMGNEQVFARAGAMLGMSAARIEEASQAWLKEPFAGVGELIDELNAAGVKTACLSNTQPHHWELITTVGSRYFLPLEKLKYRFASHLIGQLKPGEGAYRHVMQATQTPAERTLFFDDNDKNVQAARDFGWQAYRIHPVPNSMTQMREHLKRHNVL